MTSKTTPSSLESPIVGAVTYVLTLFPVMLCVAFVLQGLGFEGFNWVSVPTYIGAGILHLITVLAASTIIHTAS